MHVQFVGLMPLFELYLAQNLDVPSDSAPPCGKRDTAVGLSRLKTFITLKAV